MNYLAYTQHRSGMAVRGIYHADTADEARTLADATDAVPIAVGGWVRLVDGRICTIADITEFSSWVRVREVSVRDGSLSQEFGLATVKIAAPINTDAPHIPHAIGPGLAPLCGAPIGPHTRTAHDSYASCARCSALITRRAQIRRVS